MISDDTKEEQQRKVFKSHHVLILSHVSFLYSLNLLHF
jgi:hypothetical protein